MTGLATLIEARSARVAVIGLGYVGLPLALRIADHGFPVTGVDKDPARVGELTAGRSPLLEIRDEEIQRALESGRFTATSDSAILSQADIILICVPTPLHQGAPNMEHVLDAAVSISQGLRRGQLIILESTTYPGTTEDFLREILERSGLKAGEDFYLGFSPERIDPGNGQYHLGNVPKIVGGYDRRSAEPMEAFYSSFINKVVPVSSTKVAEMAKLLENTYRHVNIALANEMAILCHDLGIDVWEVIEAAATKPFGFHAFYPGPGWGGHCIPVDPTYLSWRVRQMGSVSRFVELAMDFNHRMPEYVVQRTAEALGHRGIELSSSSILVLGVAYKPEVSDVRESPALQVIDGLHLAGARVQFHDPYVPKIRVKTAEMSGSELTPELLAGVDLVLAHTSHAGYDRPWIAEHSRLIFDTRNFFKGIPGPIFTL